MKNPHQKSSGSNAAAVAETPESCAITPQSNGSAIVSFTLDAKAFLRLKLKAGSRGAERALWEDVLRRGVESYLY
jgi:hypothetical protein